MGKAGNEGKGKARATQPTPVDRNRSAEDKEDVWTNWAPVTDSHERGKGPGKVTATPVAPHPEASAQKVEANHGKVGKSLCQNSAWKGKSKSKTATGCKGDSLNGKGDVEDASSHKGTKGVSVNPKPSTLI